MTDQTARNERIARRKADRKQYVDHEAEHYIYRCWDAEGRLLYIGCTMDVGSRIAIHLSSWGNPASAYLALHMDRHEADPTTHVGRIAGRAAEKAAIAAEAPLLNMQHNKGRGLPRVPIEPMTDEDWARVNANVDAFFGSADGAA